MPPVTEQPKDQEKPAAKAATPAPKADKPDDQPKSEIRDVTVDGYTFKINNELLDDVELLEMIDAIENQNRPGVIISLLRSLIGEDGYKEMKAYFVKKEGRFKMSKLMVVYEAIFEDFDPKG